MRKRDGHFVNFCTLTPFPTVELPQHLLVPGLWVEGATTKPLAKKSAKSARKKSN
jgi:hypothetical protein